MISYSIPDNHTSLKHSPPGLSVSAPLGPIAEDSSQTPNTSYHRNFALLKTARRLLPNERIAQCQAYIAPNVEYVQVKLDRNSASYHNLVRCDSPSCPHCNKARSEQDRHELSVALAEAKRRGWTVILLTATLRHNRADKLNDLRKGLKSAWDKVFSGHFYQAVKDDWGIVGKVRAAETTYGGNGWHPHIHSLFFLEIALTDSQIEHLKALISTRWARKLALSGYNATYEHGIDIRTAESDIADYIAKYGREPQEWTWGADSELAKANMKKSSHDGLTPLELLGAAAGFPEAIQRFIDVVGGNDNPITIAARAGHLWIEYYWAWKRRARLHWGDMRRLLDLDQALKQYAQDNPPGPDESYTMALLPAEAWREVKRQHLEPDLLLVASGGDAGRLCYWFYQHGIMGIIPAIAYERSIHT